MQAASAPVRFFLNGVAVEARGGSSLLSWLREEKGLTGAKNACGEGVCGACSVIMNGSLVRSCTLQIEKVAGAKITTVEGIPEAEMAVYVRSFAECGAVQCGYCTPGMVIAAKALLDADPDPDEAAVRAALRINMCRCTGYAKIFDAVRMAARLFREAESTKRATERVTESTTERAEKGARPAAGRGRALGDSLPRIDAALKIRGLAKFVDDYAEPGLLFGAALRTPHPRARLLALDVSAARALPGVAVVATWKEIPGKRLTGHVMADWPTLVAVGEITRYVGDAIALVAAESREVALRALGLIVAEYEVLEPMRSPAEALAPGAPQIHPCGNELSRLKLRRGEASAALAASAHVVEAHFSTPFTDHAFMEPESALAYPPDAEGVMTVRTGEQNVYCGRAYITDTLGLPDEKVRVISAYVGGAFGGKEDQTVQHHAALLAFLSGRAVKCTLGRNESTRVHVKRHAMEIDLAVGCDARGRLLGLKAMIVADTGAYASLGGPVLHRAVTHIGGPYAYRNVDIEGVAVFTNNPPAGAFRGFGVPQVAFALESALDELAAKVGISAWELRYRNAVRPGDELPNGQLAGPDTALEECLLAVKEDFDAAAGKAGIACGFKNTGIGVGHFDVGRCLVRIGDDSVEILTGAACIGQGLATVLAQIASDTLSIGPGRVIVAMPDTSRTPESGTTTASRQTLITGEACRRACAAAMDALAKAPAQARAQAPAQAGEKAPGSAPGRGEAGAFPLAVLAGREFSGEYVAETDPFDSTKTNPVRHVAYSYACQLVTLGADGRVASVLAAHDSGLVVNPLAFEGQVEGGVAMGLGYALTEDFPLKDCVPTAKFGRLGILRSVDVPPIRTVIVRKEGRGTAVDGGVSGAAFGAKGIGEISAIPTAAAVAGAYFSLDGLLRTKLPLEGTPYSR